MTSGDLIHPWLSPDSSHTNTQSTLAQGQLLSWVGWPTPAVCGRPEGSCHCQWTEVKPLPDILYLSLSLSLSWFQTSLEQMKWFIDNVFEFPLQFPLMTTIPGFDNPQRKLQLLEGTPSQSERIPLRPLCGGRCVCTNIAISIRVSLMPSEFKGKQINNHSANSNCWHHLCKENPNKIWFLVSQPCLHQVWKRM